MSANAKSRRLATQAWVDLYEHAPPELRSELGVEVVVEANDVALVCPGLDHVFFNRASGKLGDRWRDLYAARGVRRFFVEVERREDGPAGLERFHRDWDRFHRPLGRDDTAGERETDEALRRATTRDRDAIGALFEDCFDMPRGAGLLLTSPIGRDAWCTLVAERAGEVVAAGFAFAQASGVYLAIAAVAPHARGQQLQRSLMRARLSWAVSRGCTFAATETGVPVDRQPNPSHDNMRRIGFEVVGGTSHFALPATRWGRD